MGNSRRPGSSKPTPLPSQVSATIPPPPPSEGRGAENAASQFATLLTTVLDELGFRGPTAQAKALGLVNRQTIFSLERGDSLSLSEDHFATALGSVTQLLRARQGRQRPEWSSSLTPILVDRRCGPLDVQHSLVKGMNSGFLPQRHLYDSAEAARLWKDATRSEWERNSMVAGFQSCAKDWLSSGLIPLNASQPLDLIALGSGAGLKEQALLRSIDRIQTADGQRLILVDSSLPLLTDAAQAIREEFPRTDLTALCTDFEHGRVQLTRTPVHGAGDAPRRTRLVMMFGNIFGNLADEGSFLQHQLPDLLQKGDLLWIEVATATDSVEADPSKTRADRYPVDIGSTSEGRDRLLVLPYLRQRRLEPLRDETGVGLHLDASGPASIPDSYNWRYRLRLSRGSKERFVDVLYSRRYREESLTEWLAERGLIRVASQYVPISRSDVLTGITHLLLRYQPTGSEISTPLTMR